jgi:hypothetical protein
MNKLVSAIAFSALFLSSGLAQQQTELNQVGDKLAHYIATKMPGWEHRRGSLIEGSKDVVVELWTIPHRRVKVSMMQRKSVEDARERLFRFAHEEADARELKGFGDEAYSWGEEGSNIVFRRGKYTVYVSTIADVDSDPDAVTLTREQKHERRKLEMQRLSKEIAKHAADGIDQQ